jgi:presenilin-like A22 family membrane protease
MNALIILLCAAAIAGTVALVAILAMVRLNDKHPGLPFLLALVTVASIVAMMIGNGH